MELRNAGNQVYNYLKNYLIVVHAGGCLIWHTSVTTEFEAGVFCTMVKLLWRYFAKSRGDMFPISL